MAFERSKAPLHTLLLSGCAREAPVSNAVTPPVDPSWTYCDLVSKPDCSRSDECKLVEVTRGTMSGSVCRPR